jgi:hypothetical protein
MAYDRRRQFKDANWTMAIEQQRWDDINVTMMWQATCRTLASAVSPIQGSNQLMWTV